jgi:RNA polymerase sigma factor (sigma-70 family)
MAARPDSSLVGCIPQLRRYARALTGDTWSADDLVQDTLERACDRWHLWQGGTDLRAWLFTLMHNLFVDGARRTMRQSSRRVDFDERAEQVAAPPSGVEHALDLQRCLLRLPEEQREVLLLVTLHDLSYEEVARITCAPLGTVMSRLSRARARLRELLEEPPRAAAPTPVLRRLK